MANKTTYKHYTPIKLTKETLEIVVNAMADGRPGQIDTMESAIGALIVGQSFGWRVLSICHAQVTLAKYADELGIKTFRDHCPEAGPYAERCRGYRWAMKLRDFWRGMKGEDAPPRSDRLAIDAS